MNARRRIALILGAIGLAGLGLSPVHRARATNHLVTLTEVGAGVNGNSQAQFVEIQMQFQGQNLWGRQAGEPDSRAMLVFFDGNGVQTGEFHFPGNAPDTTNRFVLIGTAAFNDLANTPDVDIVIPPLVSPAGGRVCFRNTPTNTFFVVNECVGYGSLPAAQNAPFGNPVPGSLTVTGTRSVQRRESGGVFSDTDDNATDFVMSDAPNPTRSGTAPPASIPSAGDIDKGRNLFVNETFGGNGRTCATCHVLDLNGGMPPGNVATRFTAFKNSGSFDPLFIAEPEMNLNTLVVNVNAQNPIRFSAGVVLTGTGTDGKALKVKVLTAIAPASGTQDRYLVYGGVKPVALRPGSNITDGTRSLPVASIAGGDLTALENPTRMRTSKSPDFPQGRGLILENVDGFGPGAIGPVFRKSPHLQNLSFTGPFGFSNNIGTLTEFSVGAVKQHFTRTLARRAEGEPGVTQPDFRVPTAEEQRLLEAFMLSLDSIPGDPQSDKFNIGNFARTAVQRLGRTVFETSGNCVACHGGPVLAGGSQSSGVANQPINGPTVDNLPGESPNQTFPNSTRRIAVPGLFNVKNNAPFFHDASAADLDKAVRFYTTAAFRAALDTRPVTLGEADIPNVVAFLSGLVQRPYTVKLGATDVTRAGSSVDLGSVAAGGPAVTRTLTVTNTSAAAIVFPATACALTGQTPADFSAPDCGTLGGTLAAGQSKTITVRFAPATAGAKSAILEILAPDPTGVDVAGTATASGGTCTTFSVFHLVNTAVAANPAGELMQPNKTTASGFSPTHLLNSSGFTWYTGPMTGSFAAGTHTLALWTNQPGGGSSLVRATLGTANPDGSGFTTIGTSTAVNVNATGGGNHITNLTVQASALSLSNRRLVIKVSFAGGGGNAPTMVYNGGTDFDTNLATPGGCDVPTVTVPITLHLIGTPAQGVNPAGNQMVTVGTNANGFSPTALLDATQRFWYSEVFNGNLPATTHTLSLWTSSPGGSAPVTVEIDRVDAGGAGVLQLGRSTVDVNGTGGGNHISTFTFSVPALNLASQRFRVVISGLASGAKATMVFNGGTDFDTKLVIR